MSDLPGERHKTRFIDLHQDMLSVVTRLDGDFPAYGSNYLTDSSHAAAVWSSLTAQSGSSLIEQLEAHDRACFGPTASSLRLITSAEDLDAEGSADGILPHSEVFTCRDWT